MTLRNRLLATLVFIGLLYIGIIYGTVRFFLYADFEALEKKTAHQNLLRGIQLLSAELDNLIALQEDPNQTSLILETLQRAPNSPQFAHFIKRLQQDLINTGIETIVYAPRREGPFTVAQAQGNRWEIHTVPTLSPAHQAWITYLQSQPDRNRATAGLWGTAQGIDLISGRWLHPAHPQSGVLWIAKPLSADLIAAFRIKSQVHLEFWNPHDPHLPPTIVPIVQQLPREHTIHTLISARPPMRQVYTMVFDITKQQPALLLEANTPRHITQQGKRTMWVIFVISVLSGPAVLAVMGVLVHMMGREYPRKS